jgi:hypothetical protein
MAYCNTHSDSRKLPSPSLLLPAAENTIRGSGCVSQVRVARYVWLAFPQFVVELLVPSQLNPEWPLSLIKGFI